MKNKITTQPAQHADLEEMAELLGILLSQEADFTPNIELQKKGLLMILDHPDKGQLFVAKENNKIVGMVNLLFTISTAMGKKVAILEDMIVLPEYRMSGIGSQLIEFAKAYAKNEEFGRVTLLTDSDNKKAHKFYTAHGFEKSAMVPFRFLT